MINFIILWFKALSGKMKFVVVIITMLLIFGAVQSSRLAYSEYLRLKAVEQKFKEAKEQVEASEQKELNIIKQNKKKTIKSTETNKTINEKLKQDEKSIDTITISDDDIIEFISKHQKR